MFDLNGVSDSWKSFLEEELQKDYGKKLYEDYTLAVKEANENNRQVFPEFKNIFNAFKFFHINETKIVLLGQDAYHGFNTRAHKPEAHGLCFSVQEGVKIPPSLNNIYTEIENDLGIKMSCKNGNLTHWAEQGILLLNSCLTVEEDSPASHKDLGWQTLTDNVISKLNENTNPIIFILWGKFARAKKNLITNSNHLVLEAAHPSPFSAANGFFGCRHFSKTNSFLNEKNLKSIDWQIL